jgi:hypothetical protein
MGSMWGSNVPLIGKSLVKWGKVGQIIAQPCTPSPELWVYASWKGIATIIWSLGKPTALSSHGSPGSMTVFGKHGRTKPVNQPGPRYRWNGELMPGPEIQWPTGEGWSMWKVPVMLARTAGWYLLVYDALANGALAWTSQTYQYGGCPNPTFPHLWGTQIDDIIAPHQHGAIWTLDPHSNTGINFGGDAAIIPAGRDYMAVASLSCRKTLGLPFSAATLRVVNDNTGQQWSASDPAPKKPGSSTLQSTAIVRGSTGLGSDEQIRFVVDGGGEWCNWQGSSLYIQMSHSDNLLPDP